MLRFASCHREAGVNGESDPVGCVGYVMKGYPRRGEPFISNEIFLLEQLGVSIRIFALKGLSEERHYPPVNRIRAEVTYLPESPDVTDARFSRWLWVNLPRFFPSHARLCLRRPIGYLSTLIYAFYLSFIYRSRIWPGFKKAILKDFLRAGFIAHKVVESGNIRHLHGHFCHGSTTMALFAAKAARIPYSFTAHAKDIYLPKLNPGDLLQRKINQARFVVTCTGANREHLVRLCPQADKIHTLYHGLDTDLFVSANGRDPDPIPTILSVGRFVEKKGFVYLIEACGILKRRCVDFRCHIVGEPDEASECVVKAIAAADLTDHVTLSHAVSQEALRGLYRSCTVFALPCQIASNGDRDGIPNVLVEAMSMGVAVLSTRVSGIPELIEDRVNGRLVEQKDAAALADAIEELLTQPQIRIRYGSQARQTVLDRFDSMQNTQVLGEMFAGCLNGAGKP